MRRSKTRTPFGKLSNTFALARGLALLAAAGVLLAACETDSVKPDPLASLFSPKPPEPAEAAKPAEQAKPAAAARRAEPAKPAEPKSDQPMTRSKAAMDCWMKTDKGSAGADLDKRADIVSKCIDDKMKAAAAAPKT